eukprot:TRINITY_DN18465_c0_g1_i1.p1 TRINITY_DN18465_c0_g1~~TRINITY_DN18465_c0_g1_i1.p1  ORF type:complete len:237 (-),score=17.48 TRINITY_DN18465_c0_g1_i1:312-1022(-)
MATVLSTRATCGWAVGRVQTGARRSAASHDQRLAVRSSCLSRPSLLQSGVLHTSLCSNAQAVEKLMRQASHQKQQGGQTSRGAGVRAKATKVDKSVVIPEPDYRLALSLLGIAGTLAIVAKAELLAAPFGLLGALLLVQTSRVKFVFDKETLSVLIGEELESSGENTFVGGENRWRFDTFTNWEFWWPNFPVLVYFKETQTKPEGQIHFFPVILNGKQLYDVMAERCGPSQNSGPK